MKIKFIGSVFLILYVVALPYLCRLPRGFEWADQYVSMQSNVFSQSVLLGLCSTLPAIPLVANFLLAKRIPITFALSCFTTTALLVFLYHDYPFEGDGQAVLGLIFIPVKTLLMSAAASFVFGVCEAFCWSTWARMQD